MFQFIRISTNRPVLFAYSLYEAERGRFHSPKFETVEQAYGWIQTGDFTITSDMRLEVV